MASQPARRSDPPPPSTALVARIERPANVANEISIENWQLLTDVIWPGAKDPNVIVTAFNYCKARHLDPFKRPIHIVPAYSSVLRRTVETIWPGIGELQTTASRTGEWAGIDLPVWGQMVQQRFSGTKQDYNSDRETTIAVDMNFPESCEVTVYRFVKGERVAFTEQLFWIEAYGRAGFRSEVPNDRWQKAPRQMLHKCTKAAALRAAFPEEIGNDYTSEEMEGQTVQGRGNVIEHEEPAPRRPVEKPQKYPMGAVPGSGIEPDKRPEHEKNDDAREEVTRSTATRQAKQPDPAPPDPQGGQPNYPFTAQDGAVYDWHTGTEYLGWVKDSLRKLSGKPENVRVFADAQNEHLAEISEFDPSAAVDAGEMIQIALNGAAT